MMVLSSPSRLLTSSIYIAIALRSIIGCQGGSGERDDAQRVKYNSDIDSSFTD